MNFENKSNTLKKQNLNLNFKQKLFGSVQHQILKVLFSNFQFCLLISISAFQASFIAIEPLLRLSIFVKIRNLLFDRNFNDSRLSICCVYCIPRLFKNCVYTFPVLFVFLFVSNIETFFPLGFVRCLSLSVYK